MHADLYRPSREEFLALAARAAVVPVWREVLADLQTPLAVYDRVGRGGGGAADGGRGTEGRGGGGAAEVTFLLESVERGERWGRHSFIGMDPVLSIRARDGDVTVTGAVPEAVMAVARRGDPLATIDAVLEHLRAPALDGLPPLYAGLIGYLGWDVVRFIERLDASGEDDLGLDDVRMDLPGRLVAFDHLRQRLLVVTNVLVGENPAEQYDRAVVESERLVTRLGTPVEAPPMAPPSAVSVVDARSNMPRDAYLDAVRRCKEYIAAGDAFQVVPSQRFSLRTDADALSVYRVLRVINPSPYMYLLRWPDLQVVGSSPEALVKLEGRTAAIWPIAGSRPRGTTDEEDAALEKSLLADEKERAEHVMLVDLARNDLGRVCEIGSISVEDMMEVVRYSHIMHLRSTVTGRVPDHVSGVDLVRATFPAGTLSGAPKVRAMEIIDELEPTRRGPYGGGIGYFDLAGNVDLCIAIRTLLLTNGWAHVQAGGGVVADSVPEREFEETQNKAMALLAAVRAAEVFDHGR